MGALYVHVAERGFVDSDRRRRSIAPASPRHGRVHLGMLTIQLPLNLASCVAVSKAGGEGMSDTLSAVGFTLTFMVMGGIFVALGGIALFFTHRAIDWYVRFLHTRGARYMLRAWGGLALLLGLSALAMGVISLVAPETFSASKLTHCQVTDCVNQSSN